MKFRIFSLLGFVFLMNAACTNTSSKNQPQNPGEGGASSCSLLGSWSRCSDNGDGSSSFLRLEFVGANMHETISNYNSSSDCSGLSDSQMEFNATYVAGAGGASTAIAGGTDIDLTPDVDFSGCGLNQTVYTTLKFNSACSEFQAASGVPACSPSERPTTLDPIPFLKEN